MATELVAGALLSASLQVLFERLASKEIPKLFQGKKSTLKLLDKMKTRLLSANKLLNDAEEKQLRDDNVREWLFKLQDAIYQADDLVDMMDYEALRSKLKDHDQSASCCSTKVFCRLRSMPPFAFNFHKAVQSDATEILGTLDDLLAQKDALGLREGLQNTSSQRPPAPLLEQSDVYGRDAEREVIVDLLLKDDVDGGTSISVIPIVGMGGIGKTTLAQLVYDDVRVKHHFELRVWVTVSDQFDISKITREIFEGVTSYKCDIKNPDEIRRKLKESLQGKKFMFVHDDVWNESYTLWDSLKSCFDSGANGSKIVVTTRSEAVASTMASGHVHHLTTLLDDDCWQLFVKHAFGPNDDLSTKYKDLEELGRKIVHKCKGLPLAIKSLGGLLRSERNAEKWKDILNSDTWEELYKKEGSILPALWLSYRHLPTRLKQCFAYCSIFPKDYQYEREELILLWMAQGFPPLDKSSKKMEEHGEEYLEDLLSRSLFQYSNKEKSLLQMHDLVHDLAIFVSNDFCFRLDLSNDLLNLSTKTRHLSYMKGKYNMDKVKGLCEAKSLRTFLALPFKRDFTSNMEYDMLLTSGSCLRVLSLSHCRRMKKLPHSIANHKHLRYLDLSHTDITKLPDSVCNLYNLQTLLLVFCWKIRELPKKMGRLINLRYLNIEGVFLLKELPQELSAIKHLYFLSDVILSSDGNSTGGFNMEKVGQLDNFHRISGLENIKDVREALKAKLKDKKCLSKLTLKWELNGGVTANSQKEEEKEKERDILDALRPNTNLEHLVIHGYRGSTLSEWIGDSSFCKLVSMSIINCKNCCILPPLGQLPFLKDLRIEECDSVISIGDDSYKGLPLFRCLESLQISYMPEWKDWSINSEAMQQGQISFPLLKRLELSYCKKLRVGLPSCKKYGRGTGLVPITESQQTITSITLPNVKKITLCHSKRVFDLHTLSSLESLKIVDWEDDCFPEDEGLLPTTLKTLHIRESSKLETLNGKAFQQLTSLQKLYIYYCERLQCLPEEGLPTYLSRLWIVGCPLVKQRCEKEKGEDWPKIQHITHVEVDWERIN
ncbi:hypothetical protein CsatB_018802 [Cannabis sativa]